MRGVDEAGTVNVGGEGEHVVGSEGEIAVGGAGVGVVEEGSVGSVAVVEGQVIRVGVGVVEERAQEGGARARVGRELVG